LQRAENQCAQNREYGTNPHQHEERLVVLDDAVHLFESLEKVMVVELGYSWHDHHRKSKQQTNDQGTQERREQEGHMDGFK